MSQTWHFNGTDSRENQEGDYPLASQCGVLDHDYPLVDPATIFTQENNDMVARGPRIALTCGPQDDEGDEE